MAFALHLSLCPFSLTESSMALTVIFKDMNSKILLTNNTHFCKFAYSCFHFPLTQNYSCPTFLLVMQAFALLLSYAKHSSLCCYFPVQCKMNYYIMIRIAVFWHPLQNEDCADPLGLAEMLRALDGIVNPLLLQEDIFTKQ